MRSKASQHNAGTYNGVVLWAAGGVYRVLLDTDQQVDAALRGRLKLDQRTGDRVVAGDRVCVVLHDADRSYAIEGVEERSSELARKAPGRGGRFSKVLVANVDQVVILIAAAKPEPRLRLLDRLLVQAESNDLSILIVVNKTDLVEPGFAEELFKDYVAAGYDVLFSSVKESLAIDEVSARVCGRGSVITGPSGVGKSSMLNLLQPGVELRTSEVSIAVNKGQHTTVSAQLIPLSCGGYIVDTPGMRELALWEIEPNSLDICFPEFREYIGDCKYTTSCTHTHEPDCAVRDAVEQGHVSRARYSSYCDLFSEATTPQRN